MARSGWPPGDSPLAAPVERSVNFRSSDGRPSPPEGLRYAGYGNTPEAERLHAALARLEAAQAAVVTASGMGALACALRATLRAGDHLLAGRACYGGTRALLADLEELGVAVTLADPLDRAGWTAALRPETRAVLVESPVNPTGRFLDLGELKALAGAARPLIVDGTLAPPVLFRALAHGADLVVHSATKYLGGHDDLLGGVVAGRADLVERVRRRMSVWGQAPDGFARWLLERGPKTLDLRVARQSATALHLAQWLAGRRDVRRVHYLGLATHPDHHRAVALGMTRFGAVLGFEVASAEAASKVVGRLRRFAPTSSFGGVTSLVSEPRFNSHAELPRAEREALGVPDGFVRLSVGVEPRDELLADLEQALDA